MTVRAEELNIASGAQGDFSVEGDPVLHQAFVVPATVHVVQLQHAGVFDAAGAAATSQGCDGLGAPLSVSSLPGLSGEFVPALRVGGSPGVHAGLLGPVDAGLAAMPASSLVEREIGDRSLALTGATDSGFHGSHVENSTGIRKDVHYDDVMAGRQ